MKKTWQKILASLLVVLAAMAMIYFLVFDKVAVVCDPTFSINMSKADYFGFRVALFAKGARLKVVNIDSETITNQAVFIKKLTKLDDCDIVVLSPVLTALCNVTSLDLSKFYESSIAVGIASDASDNFDVILYGLIPELGEGEVDYRNLYADSAADSVVLIDLESSITYLLDFTKEEFNHDVAELFYETRKI